MIGQQQGDAERLVTIEEGPDGSLRIWQRGLLIFDTRTINVPVSTFLLGDGDVLTRLLEMNPVLLANFVRQLRQDGKLPNGKPMAEKKIKLLFEERNRCLALLARLAMIMGDHAGLVDSLYIDKDYFWLVIDLPSGQVSWLIKNTHRGLFEGLPPYTGELDRLTRAENDARMDSAYQSDFGSIEHIQLDVTQMLTEVKREKRLAALAADLLRNTPDSELCADHLQIKRELEASDPGPALALPRYKNQAQQPEGE